MAEPVRDDVEGATRETELIDLARLGAADPRFGVAVRGGAGDSGADADADADPEDDYDPGWLGTVLRWPIRVVAVIVIAPVQVAWETVKAAGRVVGRGLRKVASALGRPFRAVGRAIGWAATRVLWWPLRWMGRGLAVIYRFTLRPLGRGIAHAATWIYRSILTPIGHGMRAVGRVVARGLYYLTRPFVLLARGLGYVLRLLGGWFIGLLQVIGEAFEFAARVGAKIGRGVVWLWTHSLWVPIRFVGKGFWDAAKWVGRGVRTVTSPIGRGLRALRAWYRREVSEPVMGALRAARRDIRRALFGQRRG